MCITTYLGRMDDGRFLYEFDFFNVIKINQSFTDEIDEKAYREYLTKIAPKLIENINNEFKEVTGNIFNKITFYAQHRNDPRSQKIDELFELLMKEKLGLCNKTNFEVLIDNTYLNYNAEDVERLVGFASIESEVKNEIGKSKIDNNQLLVGESEINPAEYAWHLQLGLLKHAFDAATDVESKDQIRFIANNYLAKAAPILNRTIALTNRVNFDGAFQITPFPRHRYHRQTGFSRKDFNETLNERLGLGKSSPLLLVDTVEILDLFSTGFKVLDKSQTLEKWQDIILKSIQNHMKKKLQDPLKKKLSPNFLLNLTAFLSDIVITEGDYKKERLFKTRLKKIIGDIKNVIKNVVDLVFPKENYLEKLKLNWFIKKNIVTVCGVDLGNFGGIKILPMFRPLVTYKDVKKVHPAFTRFIGLTGIFMGAINYRRYMLDSFALREDIRYAPQGINATFFPNLTDFTKTALFTRLSKKFSEEKLMLELPHIYILGESTIKIIQGLLQEIDPHQWNLHNQQPGISEIIQNTLLKLHNNLANAELYLNDFSKFSTEIELAHNEIAVLLEVFKPFAENEFSAIYKEQLVCVPDSLRSFLQAGLGKTAVNTFAGINSVLMQTNKKIVRAYGPNLYFEEVFFLGSSKKLDKILSNKKIEKIDLYACQFHSNIDISKDKTEYSTNNIIKDVKKILRMKSKTEHLTIAIDCTIDYLNSPHVYAVLKKFEEEIKNGKLNFIFFRSGQKFDMLGMDNYYGSPFFIVNNQSEAWKGLNTLLTSKKYRTDLLSLQWFCLANRYIPQLMDVYRKQIFDNSRTILEQVPESLKPNNNPNQTVRVNTVVDDQMCVSFIDIKVSGEKWKEKTEIIERKFFEIWTKQGIVVQSRPSFGFYIPNLTKINSSSWANIRINPGLDPQANVAIVRFLEAIAQEKYFHDYE